MTRPLTHRPFRSFEPLEGRVLFAAGDLDPTFGSGGVTSFDYGEREGVADVVAQSDGKVIVVGPTGADRTNEYDFLLARLNADGSRDTSFGNGGFTVTDFGGGHDVPRAAVQMADGSILVVGVSRPTPESSDHWAVARYTADGLPDTRFSGDGRDLLDVRGDAEAVDLQPDGKAVVVGRSEFVHFGVARFNADGTLDASFGGDGFVTTAFNNGNSGARVVDVMADGRIVAAGSYSGGGDAGGVVARYLPDGRLDPAFSSDGRSFIEDPYPWPTGISVQSDAKIVLLEGDLTLRRLRAGGGFDLTFGDGGVARLDVASPDEIQFSRDVLRQPDGKLLVSGFAGNYRPETPDTHRQVLSRFTPDGRIDGTFGDGGMVQMPTNRDGLYRSFGALSLAPNGKIVVGGSDTRPGAAEFDYLDDFAVYRFLNDLALPPPPPQGVWAVQGEDAERPLSGAVVAADNRGYTGSGYLDFLANAGAAAWWNVGKLPGAGDYVIDFRYANGSGTRTLALEASPGTPAKNLAFASTGGWKTWKTLSVPVTLTGAANSIGVVLRTIGSNGPNIDSLTVRRAGTPPAGLDLQAEQAALVGARVARGNGGFTGSGYADFTNGTGDSVEWTFDHAGGSRTLSFRYANGSTGDRPLELRVNGQVINPRLSFAPTGSWNTWREVSVTVTLAAGNNRVKLTSVGNNGANIDVLEVG